MMITSVSEARIDELEMGNGGEGNRDKENRQGGNNTNKKAMGTHTTRPHRADAQIQLRRVGGGVWAIIVVATISFVPIWLSLYSLSWTGGRDVVSKEENMLTPHVTHVQRPSAANYDKLNDTKQLLAKENKRAIDDLKKTMGEFIDEYKTKTDDGEEINPPFQSFLNHGRVAPPTKNESQLPKATVAAKFHTSKNERFIILVHGDNNLFEPGGEYHNNWKSIQQYGKKHGTKQFKSTGIKCQNVRRTQTSSGTYANAHIQSCLNII